MLQISPKILNIEKCLKITCLDQVQSQDTKVGSRKEGGEPTEMGALLGDISREGVLNDCVSVLALGDVDKKASILSSSFSPFLSFIGSSLPHPTSK